ncbi:RNA polymerase-associated LEO1 family protein [Sporobolomyces koalae]|uniref:RNA polymerase-associated LEO1 family protein n=1 Tax=Sporobolomyces koalae TaxID=500713 RepID=UPI003172E0FA
MDPVVDTGFDEGVNNDLVNPVQPHTLEQDMFPTQGADVAAPPPELYPHGATGQLEGAAPVPGSTSIDQLPVPPPKYMLQQQQQQQDNEADDDDDDEVHGDDLFGDDDDNDDDDDLNANGVEPRLPTPPPLDDGLTAEERAERSRMEYSDNEDTDLHDPEQEITTHEERIAQVPLVNYSVPAGGKVWHAKLPNFLRLDTAAWNEHSWQPEQDDVQDEPDSRSQDPNAAEDSRSKSAGKSKANLPDENVIRWRWTKDQLGQYIKQSNARVVRWSDGSLSLQVGSELFDISLALDHSANLSRAQNPVQPSTSQIGLTPTTFDQNRGHGLTYLTARHDYNKMFEAQASVEGTMTFRPSTLTSQTHKRLAGSVAARYGQKGRAIKTMMLDADPEKQKLEREKLELEKQRKAKKEAQRAAGGRGGRGARKASKKATTLEGLDLSDEDEDDGQGVGYADRRSQPKRGRGGALRGYSDDEDDEGFLAKSDEEEDARMSDNVEEELEAADRAIDRRRKDRSRKQREYSASSESDKEEASQGGAVRRRMVIDESDDE